MSKQMTQPWHNICCQLVSHSWYCFSSLVSVYSLLQFEILSLIFFIHFRYMKCLIINSHFFQWICSNNFNNLYFFDSIFDFLSNWCSWYRIDDFYYMNNFHIFIVCFENCDIQFFINQFCAFYRCLNTISNCLVFIMYL